MSERNIIFTYQDHYGDYHMETIRASRAGTCYRIEGIPLFTPAISRGDIVSAIEEEDQLHFEMVLDSSGHSTIQVVFFDNRYLETALKDLENMGCSWEASREKRLVAVDVPDDVQYSLVLHYFEVGEEESKWTYKESCLSHY
ncbi:MAG: DUF4265 domain-containing protein [Chitinophagaceae bacterium]|nr:DUF4265 domain-containing protein [Chitinophagaceae bacterium]